MFTKLTLSDWYWYLQSIFDGLLEYQNLTSSSQKAIGAKQYSKTEFLLP